MFDPDLTDARLLVEVRQAGLWPPHARGPPLDGRGLSLASPCHWHHRGGPREDGAWPAETGISVTLERFIQQVVLTQISRSYRRVLHHLALDVAEHVAPVVDKELVVLEHGVSRGVLSLDISQEFPQLSATLADSSEIKSLNTSKNFLAHRDMSSVMWILLPLRTPDFLRTSSRSLNSWKVTTTGL